MKLDEAKQLTRTVAPEALIQASKAADDSSNPDDYCGYCITFLPSCARAAIVLADALDAAEADTKEQDVSIELRRDADRRARDRWQKATGKAMEWPDSAMLSVWLMERLEAAEARLARLSDEQSELDVIDALGGDEEAMKRLQEQAALLARLPEILALSDAATQGPWKFEGNHLWHLCDYPEETRDGWERISGEFIWDDDGVFSAAARDDVPDVCALALALAAECERLREEVKRAKWAGHTEGCARRRNVVTVCTCGLET